MLRFLALFALIGLAGCARGVTIDDAYGRPDATSWTYFKAPPSQVVDALLSAYREQSLQVISVVQDSDAGGTLITLSPRGGSADTEILRVQRTSVEGYGSRAQLYPRNRPLPRDLEDVVSGLLVR